MNVVLFTEAAAAFEELTPSTRAASSAGQPAKKTTRARTAAPARPSVLMEEMTMTEVRDAIAAGKTTVLLYSASIEASGPHIALGKHLYKVRHLGERIAHELGTALVPPVMPFAPTSDQLNRFPGTINLSADTFSKVNEEVAESLVRTGFRCIILMGDHGSIADTSEVWAADPRSVRPDKIAMGDPIQRTAAGAVIGPSRVEGDPRPSSVRVRALNGPLGSGSNPGRASARYRRRRGGCLPGISSPTGSACRFLLEPRKSGTGRSDLLPSACRLS